MKSFLSPLLRIRRIVARADEHPSSSDRRADAADGVRFEKPPDRPARHDSLPEGSALIIAPSQAIHTFSMRFSIDVAFVSKDGLVLKVRQAVPPRRIAVSWRAFAVIELPAGALEASDTKPGDRLQIEGR